MKSILQKLHAAQKTKASLKRSIPSPRNSSHINSTGDSPRTRSKVAKKDKWLVKRKNTTSTPKGIKQKEMEEER